jgi:hypothetical protein
MKLNFHYSAIAVNHICIITCVLAIALQIQVTLFENSTYSGLRINLADILLPFIGIFIIGSLLLKQSKWPKWGKPLPIYIGFISLIVLMSIALLQGYLTNEQLSSWAFINKYIGFIILISYTLLGGWLATNSLNKSLPLYFTKLFCGFFVLTLVASVIALIIEYIFHVPLWIGDYQWDGFMANRNAYMLLAIFSIIAIEIYHRFSENLLPNWAYNLFWMLIPFFVIFNASRTFWIIGGIIVLIYFVTRPIQFIKKILPFIIIGSILCAACISLIGQKKSENFKQFFVLKQLITEGPEKYIGDQKRVIAAKDGLELYNKSNPIIGAGLGSYREFQTEKRGEFIDIIDFTALWLLVETGALGLFIFSSFLCLCLWIFYQQGITPLNSSPFHYTLLFFLLAFTSASFLHEITYTRFVWFLLGLGLVSVSNLMPSNSTKPHI